MRDRQWAIVLPVERFEAERLGAERLGAGRVSGSERMRVELPADDGQDLPGPGDRIALIAGTEPQVLFGLGRVVDARIGSGSGPDVLVQYQRRLLDAPPPLPVPVPVGVSELTGDGYAALTALVAPVTRFLVSVSLPIEATSPAEAVREFWVYLDTLGPAELPTFVSPAADELAMQAFVLGAETNLDPEED